MREETEKSIDYELKKYLKSIGEFDNDDFCERFIDLWLLQADGAAMKQSYDNLRDLVYWDYIRERRESEYNMKLEKIIAELKRCYFARFYANLDDVENHNSIIDKLILYFTNVQDKYLKTGVIIDEF